MTEHLTGRVKWFNNKAGFGFITVIDDSEHASMDFFVHHSAVNVEDKQYRYLVQGEYVEFDLMKSGGEKHLWQATKVTGIRGGKLMCETRTETKVFKETVVNSLRPAVAPAPEPAPVQEAEEAVRKPRQRKPASTSKPKGKPASSKEWTLVSSDAPASPAKKSAPRRSRKPQASEAK